MLTLEFSYENAGFSHTQIQKAAAPLNKEIIALKKATESGYVDARSSINLPSDETYLNQSLALAKKYHDVSLIIVIGIGGSNLGTLAVFEAIKGRYSNLLDNQPEVLFADTIDPDQLHAINEVLEFYLDSKKKALLCFITKSGGTTETVANFEILYQTLQKKRKDAKEYVVAITDEHSHLDILAKKEGFATLNIPKTVGGRYSVFSAVGIFPLAIAGIDVKELLRGAEEMREQCLTDDLSNNPAAISAALLYLNATNERPINDNFFFATDLESIGKWYRQLMGESVGKEFSTKQKRINAGITPTVSIGSTDLHSMAQLYLGGPFDKYTTIVRLHTFNHEEKLPTLEKYSTLVPHIQGRSAKELLDAIVQGVMAAYQKNKRPYNEIVLENKSAHTIGALLQFKMMEMMMLGVLMDVNPFDQPNVEAYKVETKKILEKSK